MTYHNDTDVFDDLNHLGNLALSRAGKTGPVRDGVQRRIDRLEARLRADEEASQASLASLAPTCWSSNGEAGDGQTVCSVCEEETDEPHPVSLCLANLKASNQVLWGQVGELEEAARKHNEKEWRP